MVVFSRLAMQDDANGTLWRDDLPVGEEAGMKKMHENGFGSMMPVALCNVKKTNERWKMVCENGE